MIYIIFVYYILSKCTKVHFHFLNSPRPKLPSLFPLFYNSVNTPWSWFLLLFWKTFQKFFHVISTNNWICVNIPGEGRRVLCVKNVNEVETERVVGVISVIRSIQSLQTMEAFVHLPFHHINTTINTWHSIYGPEGISFWDTVCCLPAKEFNDNLKWL